MSPILHSALLARCSGIQHGFGTRHSGLSQDGMASLKQVHSGRVVIVSGPGCAGEADALIAATRGLTLSVRTADCYPILLADSDHRAVAAVHAGWRGTAHKIVCRAVEEMHGRFGVNPAAVLAAIGPGIGECCYRVGKEVARKFGLEEAGTIDLAEQNRLQLIESGVSSGNIEMLGLCTFCDPGAFYSYRRDPGNPARMISFIRLE